MQSYLYSWHAPPARLLGFESFIQFFPSIIEIVSPHTEQRHTNTHEDGDCHQWINDSCRGEESTLPDSHHHSKGGCIKRPLFASRHRDLKKKTGPAEKVSWLFATDALTLIQLWKICQMQLNFHKLPWKDYCILEMPQETQGSCDVSAAIIND